LAPLTFVRPGELRAAEWTEFDLDHAVWRIPASRMKMDEQHVVPLSRQALSILRELHVLTGDGKYLSVSSHAVEMPERQHGERRPAPSGLFQI
jgi:integrase